MYLLCWKEVEYDVEDVEGSPADKEHQGDQEKEDVGSFPPGLLSSLPIQILQLVQVLRTQIFFKPFQINIASQIAKTMPKSI